MDEYIGETTIVVYIQSPTGNREETNLVSMRPTDRGLALLITTPSPSWVFPIDQSERASARGRRRRLKKRERDVFADARARGRSCEYFSASRNQQSNSIFLPKRSTSTSSNQHQHQPANRLSISLNISQISGKATAKKQSRCNRTKWIECRWMHSMCGAIT